MVNVRKGLASLLLGLSLVGCGEDNSTYNFSGEIEGKHVFCYNCNALFSSKTVLIVREPDYKTGVEYFCDNGVLSLAKISVLKLEGNAISTSSVYSAQSKSEVDRTVIEEGRKVFRDYLVKIKQENIRRGVESLGVKRCLN